MSAYESPMKHGSSPFRSLRSTAARWTTLLGAVLFAVSCGSGTGDASGEPEPGGDDDTTNGDDTSGDDDTSKGGGASVPEPQGGASPGASAGAPQEPEAMPQPAAFEYRACDASERVGAFRVDLAPDDDAAPQFTSVTGSVTDGVVPTDVPVVVAEAEDCRLLRNPDFNCDPSCGAGETCGADGCLPYPTARSVGEVTVTGLLVPLVMTPSGRNSYSNPVSAMLPHPGFEPAAELSLSAEGDTFEGFTLRGWGVNALAVPPGTVTVESDVPVQIRWEAPTDAGPAKVHVALNIDNHGSSTARIECLTQDDGELDIPAELSNALMEQGTSGLPSLLLRRQTVDGTELEHGCVELLVASELVRSVEVEGLISCQEDEDCPDGQACLPNLACGTP